MLLVFRTSPYSVPRSSPISNVGFLLDINIKFVDAGSEGIVPRDKTTGAAELLNNFFVSYFTFDQVLLTVDSALALL